MSADRSWLPPGEWNGLERARVAPLDHSALSLPARVVLALIRRRTGTPDDFNVFRTFARLGGIFPTHTVLVSQLLGKGRLSSREKELVILRVAWRLGCVYEWGHHTHMARELGVDEAEIEAVATDEIGSELSDRLTAFVAIADELLATHALSDETWALGRKSASDDELLELCFLVGHYVMVALTLNGVGVQLEPEFAHGR